MTKKWNQSLWEAQQRYEATEKAKERRKQYEATEEAKERRKRYEENLTHEQKEKRREQKRLCAERRREREKRAKEKYIKHREKPMNHPSYFVIKGTKSGVPVYKTNMRTRPNAWSPDPIGVKKYRSRKTAEGSLESKFVTLYSVGIANIGIEEIAPNDPRWIPPHNT